MLMGRVDLRYGYLISKTFVCALNFRFSCYLVIFLLFIFRVYFSFLLFFVVDTLSLRTPGINILIMTRTGAICQHSTSFVSCRLV